MRRKYDIRNKRSFLVILILMVLVVFVFSLFIYKYTKALKVEYLVESGAIIQDTDKNYIQVDDDAKLKIRWNDNYYLVYQDKEISLGKKVIVYNEITGSLKLYGDFYEIQEEKSSQPPVFRCRWKYSAYNLWGRCLLPCL